MASSRAAEVAEALWELKRADKIATYSAIAERAGFSAGANGRAMNTCLKTVRRDWPHLQWWRAISDDATVEEGSEQAERLTELGIEIDRSSAADGQVKLTLLDDVLMTWNQEPDGSARS
jgi:alkylated DNA nucleotide flippase Atl1